MVCRYVNWSAAPPLNVDAAALLANGGANVAAAAVTSMRWEVLLAMPVVSADDASTVANTVLIFFNSMDFTSCSSLLVIGAALT